MAFMSSWLIPCFLQISPSTSEQLISTELNTGNTFIFDVGKRFLRGLELALVLLLELLVHLVPMDESGSELNSQILQDVHHLFILKV